MGWQMMLWIQQPNGLADRCRVPLPYNLETMSCIVGHIVMWDVMPRGRFYLRSILHLGHIALGRLVTFSFWAETFGICIFL
jgi:hypothetical protein